MSASTTSQVSSNTLSGQSNIAFALSLIAGVLITVGSLVGVSFAMMGLSYFWGMGGMMYGYSGFMNGMMGHYYSNGYYPTGFFAMMAGIEVLGLISGVLVLIFALRMRSRPANIKTYGILVLVFSIVSIFGNGGFVIGAILGIVGGALALASG